MFIRATVTFYTPFRGLLLLVLENQPLIYKGDDCSNGFHIPQLCCGIIIPFEA